MYTFPCREPLHRCQRIAQLNIVVECLLLDTGCLFAKADVARRLGTHTQSANTKRLVTLADGSLTSSVGYVRWM
jgi:hypothetical protein